MNWKPKPNDLHFYFGKFLISSNQIISFIQFTPFKFLAQKLELIENKKHKLGKTRKHSSKNFIKGLPDIRCDLDLGIYPPKAKLCPSKRLGRIIGILSAL